MAMINKEWKFADIFALSKVELDKLKVQVANKVQCKYKSVGSEPFKYPCAHEVGGTPAFDQVNAHKVIKLYLDLLNNKPVKQESDSEAAFKTKIDRWSSDLSRASSWTTVINACQLSWESPNGPWNQGYIESFWQRMASGDIKWDHTLDRKAGGIDVKMDMPLSGLALVPMSASSLMALIAGVVYHVVRDEEIPTNLAQAFMSVKVTWVFGASKDEIINMSILDNIEQHKRKRHTEFDNIFQVRQWMDTMAIASGGKLDPKKAIDVVKYALIMGNPLAPADIPPWLNALLKEKPPTFVNKVAAVTQQGVTKNFINDNKITILHPEMKRYPQIMQRARAVAGFGFWDSLHKQVWQEMGRRGLGHMPCPLTANLLLDQNIFNAQGFSSKAERENIPMWRDGAQGKLLQEAMVEVARARLFDHNVVSGVQKALFSNGNQWTALARLNGPPHWHVDSVLLKEFGPMESWSDSVKATWKSTWTGEFDVELSKMSSLLPSNLDGQPHQMQARVKELFTPMQQLLHARQSEAQRMHTTQAEKEAEAKKKAEQEAKEKAAADGVPDVLDGREDGDVTDDLCPETDAATKRKLCEQMNAQAKKKREADMEQAFLQAAAAILRNRLVVVDSFQAAKAYMESSSTSGYKCRITYCDFTQHSSLQSKGSYTKVLCNQPNLKFQETMAQNILMLPMTSIIGTVLTRSGGVGLEKFSDKMSASFGRPSSLFVPVAMPAAYLKHIKSATKRALGPHIDTQERSGIEYSMRMVGAKGANSDVHDGIEMPAEEDEGEEVEEEADAAEGTADGDADVASLETMTTEHLKKAFGRGALFMLGAMFQHSSKISEEGMFLDPKNMVLMTKESGKKITYRKSQVHPSTVHAALKSVLSSTSAALNPQDVLVQACGGTPEAVVAGVMTGFSKIIYVAEGMETVWMKLPTEAEEKLHNIDYNNFTSPSIDAPDSGCLAASAVKMLAPYIRNYVLDVPSAVKISPPHEIDVPPMKLYVFIAVTGRVLLRTVLPGATEQNEKNKQNEKQKEKQNEKGQGEAASSSTGGASSGGPGSSTGKVEPKTPQVKGKVTADEHDETAGDDEAMEEGEGDMDADIAALEAMEAEATTPKDGKKRGRPKNQAVPKSGKKAKAKA